MSADKLCRLQEYCEKLLFNYPLEYGRKAEELLWRKAFYEIIQLMKHNRKVSWKFQFFTMRYTCILPIML